jgi:signal transduction histidine kinase
MEKEAEDYRARLRELADRLAATEETERRRVSTQIHDTVIQTLSLSSIRLGGLRKAAEAAGLAEQCEKVDQVRGLLDAGIGECRNLMADLTPPLLYELGLGPALRDLAKKQQKANGIGVEVEEDDEPKPLNEARRGFLFQAARELIMNAVKHANAERILISLSRVDEEVCLCVRDTGCGFAPANLDGHIRDFEKGGFGLFNIRERLQSLGGRLDIVSAPGKGTAVTVRIPMSG